MRDSGLGPPSPRSTQVWVQPEGVRAARPLLLPYELRPHARGWDPGPKVGRGVGVLQNNCLVTHVPVHHPRRRKEERQMQATPARREGRAGGWSGLSRAAAGKAPGGGDFAGRRLTQPHHAAGPCLTLLHPHTGSSHRHRFFAEL